LRLRADRLAVLFRSSVERGQPWFEPYLSYDNGRLAEALIRAGAVLGDEAMTADGLAALSWLCRRQTGATGLFQPVATVDFGRPLDAQTLFDQQPVEAASTIDACQAAWSATGNPSWIEEAERAFAWFLGANTLGASLVTADGDCFDGLTWAGVNENQGAESVLSLQLSICALRTLTGAAGGRLKTVNDA
jgi:hypothetical protein